MNIIFADASTLPCLSAELSSDKNLHIKITTLSIENIISVFTDKEKTKRIEVWNEGRQLAVFEDYTSYIGVIQYAVGVYEPILSKGNTIAEDVDELKEQMLSVSSNVEQNNNDISDAFGAIAELAEMISGGSVE